MLGLKEVTRPRVSRRTCWSLAGMTVLAATTGCSRMLPFGGTVQVQFYSPENAVIAVRNINECGMEIRTCGPLADRLEHGSATAAVFDLSPGTYPIAYAKPTGAQEAVVYGELEIRSSWWGHANRFLKHSFVPIKLPSLARQTVEHLHPSRDLSFTVGLEDREFDHIRQGDMMTKVYFVADLERVEHEYEIEYLQAINDLDRELTVLADRGTYLDTRYEAARQRALYRDPEVNIEDKIAHERFDKLGIEESFVRLSKKRQALLRDRETILLERTELEEERARRNALLRSIQIVHRSGALVLATPDLVRPYHDIVSQTAELGDIVAVLTVGGRHQYWASHLTAPTDSHEMHEHAAAEVASPPQP